jgi:hypothetical protein
VIGMIEYWVRSLDCVFAILLCGIFEAFMIEAIYVIWKSER